MCLHVRHDCLMSLNLQFLHHRYVFIAISAKLPAMDLFFKVAGSNQFIEAMDILGLKQVEKHVV